MFSTAIDVPWSVLFVLRSERYGTSPTRYASDSRAGFEEEQTFEDFDWEAPVTFDRDRVRGDDAHLVCAAGTRLRTRAASGGASGAANTAASARVLIVPWIARLPTRK